MSCRAFHITRYSAVPGLARAEAGLQAVPLLADQRAHGYRCLLLWLYGPWLAYLSAAVPAVGRIVHCKEYFFEMYPQEIYRVRVRKALAGNDLAVAVSEANAVRTRTQVSHGEVGSRHRWMPEERYCVSCNGFHAGSCPGR